MSEAPFVEKLMKRLGPEWRHDRDGMTWLDEFVHIASGMRIEIDAYSFAKMEIGLVDPLADALLKRAKEGGKGMHALNIRKDGGKLTVRLESVPDPYGRDLEPKK